MRSALLLLLLGITACAGTESARNWTGSVETLPNGAVRVSNPPEGVWSEQTAWRLVPEVTIGEVDGAAEYTFGAIAGLEIDDGGRIYVVDRQANELRIFESDGRHVRTVGRAGGGPGEFRNANGIGWLAPDSLVVIDQPGRRYSIFNRDGDFVRSVPRILAFYMWKFDGTIVGDHIYEPYRLDCDVQCRPVLLRLELRAAEHAPVDTIALPFPPHPEPEVLTATFPQGQRFLRLPFSAARVYHYGPRGDIVHAHGAEFRIVHTTLAGDTIREIELAAEPVPVSQREIDEWAAGEDVQSFREVGGRVDLSRVPRVKPFLEELYLDPDGYLWVTIPADAAATAFAIFDPEGKYLGRLRIEGVSRPWPMPFHVRNGRLYLLGADDLDVQRVYVYRIAR